MSVGLRCSFRSTLALHFQPRFPAGFCAGAQGVTCAPPHTMAGPLQLVARCVTKCLMRQSASIRWPVDLKQRLEALARADGRSFSNFVIHVLRQHVGLPNPAVPSAIAAPVRATSERRAKTRKKRGTRNP